MPQEVWNIIWSAVGIAVTGLVTWLTTTAIAWLNSKIKNEKVARWTTAIAQIIFNAVQTIQQTFVDTMKAAGKFDEAAAKEAKEKCVAIIKGELSEELRNYITDNFGDMEEYLMNQIEAVVYQLKR